MHMNNVKRFDSILQRLRHGGRSIEAPAQGGRKILHRHAVEIYGPIDRNIFETPCHPHWSGRPARHAGHVRPMPGTIHERYISARRTVPRANSSERCGGVSGVAPANLRASTRRFANRQRLTADRLQQVANALPVRLAAQKMTVGDGALAKMANFTSIARQPVQRGGDGFDIAHRDPKPINARLEEGAGVWRCDNWDSASPGLISD